MKGKGKERDGKNKGKKKAVTGPKEPETFEEIMEEGVKQEEKGERYGTGEKAERFYERARELYAKAHQKKPNDADCLYNWGRILYILVSFVPPHAPVELKLDLLVQSIEKFRAAVNIGIDNADALFNLAQALASKADVIQERDTDAFDDARASLHEAVQLFESVFMLQQKELQESTNFAGPYETTTPSGDSKDSFGPSSSSSSSSSLSPSLTRLNTSTSGAETAVTEIIAVTAETLIDTLLAITNTLSSLASLMDSMEVAEKYYNQAIQKLEQASDYDVASKESEIQHQWANIYASQAERAYSETGNIFQAQSLYEIATQKMNSVVEQDSSNVEAICDRGDLLAGYANTLMKSVEGNREQQEKIRDLFELAIKSFGLALDLEPAKAAILDKLASLNFTMSLLPFAVIENNVPTLHSQALAYYERALEADKDNLDTHLYYALVLCHVPGRDGYDVVKILREFKERGGTKEYVEEWRLENIELLRSSAIGKEYVGRVIETCFLD